MNDRPIDDCWNRIGIRGDKSCDKLTEHIHCHHCDVYADAASAIMRRTIPPAYRSEWTRHYAEKPPGKPAEEESAMVFRVGAEWLALPLRLALAVAAPAPVHRVPHRPAPALLGIVHVRGALYPCMSLAALLDIDIDVDVPADAVNAAAAVRRSRAFARLLVTTLGEQAYALPVQEVRGIHRYAASELGPPPTTGNAASQTYVSGVLSIDGIRVGCLDARRLAASFAGMLK